MKILLRSYNATEQLIQLSLVEFCAIWKWFFVTQFYLYLISFTFLVNNQKYYKSNPSNPYNSLILLQACTIKLLIASCVESPFKSREWPFSAVPANMIRNTLMYQLSPIMKISRAPVPSALLKTQLALLNARFAELN